MKLSQSLIIWHFKPIDDTAPEWGEYDIMANANKIGRVFYREDAVRIVNLMNDLENKLNVEKFALLLSEQTKQ